MPFVVFAVLAAPETGPVNPLWLIRLVTVSCLLPALAGLLLRRAFTGRIDVAPDSLVLERHRRRVEIPLGAITAIEPWRLPVPGSGFRIRLRSGRRWSDGVETREPGRLIEALATAGAAPAVRDALRHPSVVWADAKAQGRRRRWYHPLLRYPVFALVPTLPLFRVHQIIAYGGTFGEYQQYGLGSWLLGFAIYWATLTIYLLVYAAILRVPVEAVAAGAALLVPRHAAATRRILERTVAVLYYAGVPVAVVLRFIPW